MHINRNTPEVLKSVLVTLSQLTNRRKKTLNIETCWTPVWTLVYMSLTKQKKKQRKILQFFKVF